MAAALGWPNSCKGSDLSPSDICGQPAARGDDIQIYVTGLGKVTPDGDKAGTPLGTGQTPPADGSVVYQTLLKPVVTVGGVAATVAFAGPMPGTPGMYQIAFKIPTSAPLGDDVAVIVNMPGQGSDTATISIH